MSNIDKVVSCINSMDPIRREAILMDLKNIHTIHKMWIDGPEEFDKKHSLHELYSMEDDFESKLKNLTGLKNVPMWQIIYYELFKEEVPF